MNFITILGPLDLKALDWVSNAFPLDPWLQIPQDNQFGARLPRSEVAIWHFPRQSQWKLSEMELLGVLISLWRNINSSPLPHIYVAEPMQTYCKLNQWTKCSEIRIKIQVFSFMKMHLKMSSAKLRPFSSEGDELTHRGRHLADDRFTLIFLYDFCFVFWF